ncbi:MAG: right-handed parallel beta-helix repeat-containing protein [Chloroflexi bacterium]|nr:right-handed parallel beta-helix repeat-containing protein [Chloroflexota bacterium]
MSKTTRFYAHPWPHTGRLIFPLLLGAGFFLFLWFMLTGNLAQAEPLACVPGPHSGIITSDETWCAANSPHQLTGDVTVAATATLTIEPGVTIRGSNNVELKVQGHLDALGTPAQPITLTSATNTGPNQWSGLIFDGGTGNMDYVTVRYGGNVNSLNSACHSSGMGFNIGVRNVLTGEVRIQNSLVRSESYLCNAYHTSDYGLYVENSRVVVDNTVFQANGNNTSDYPIYAWGANTVITLTNNSFVANARQRVLFGSGLFSTQDVTLWPQTGLEAYELTSDLTIPTGITLTVAPGITVMGRANVELRTEGYLEAIGTPSQPITFTSATNSGGNQWSGLVFEGTAGEGNGNLNYVTVRYGGDANSLNTACNASGLGFNIGVRNVLTGTVHIQNSTLRSAYYLCNAYDANDYGLYVEESRVIVDTTLFQANGRNTSDYALHVLGMNSELTLTGNSFVSNQRNRVLLAPGALTGADFALVDETGLESYELTADFTIPAGITMTVEPGVMVMGRSGVELRTEGHLEAIGTPTQPITFTSATNTSNNQWAGLVFEGTAGGGTGHLRYATVRYGGNVNSLNSACNASGRGFNIGVRNVLNGEVRLENSLLRNAAFLCNAYQAADHNLYVENSHVTVLNTAFTNNGSSTGDYSVYVTGASTALTFENNIVRNNLRGLQLDNVGTQVLRNNVIMDNSQNGLTVGAGATIQLLHTTIARNNGDGVTVSSGGSVALTNTILSENVTGVRVNAGGAAALMQTLWHNNTTQTVGTVSQTGSQTGDPLFAADGYHLTRYSLAMELGVEAGVATDMDGQARPLPSGTLPDVGADEYDVAQELIFEKIALAPVWIVTQAIPSGGVRQRYLLPFRYGSPDANATPLTVTVTDTLPAQLTLLNQSAWPLMTFGQNGQTLTWQTQTPVGRNQSGLIDITTTYANAQPGASLPNTALLQAGPYTRTGQAVVQIPVMTPLLITPGTGELCAGPTEVRGLAQPGMTVYLSVNGIVVTQTLVSNAGEFTMTYPYSGLANETLTVQACTAGGQCSPVSAGIEVRPPQSFFCAQRSSWEGTPTTGPRAGKHLEFNFRDSSGEFSSQNWEIPGVYGFWNTTLHMHGCNCPAVSGTTAPPSSVWVIADGVRYDPVGVYPNYTFNITGAAHVVEFWAQCGANQVSSSGRVLIDPDGYVFDVTQGFDAQNPTLNAVAGVTVTLYMSSTEWGGWTPWPAHMFNNQVNPQVTETDGYFAFFTPPGFYYLQVEGKPGYQSWRSPVIQVVNEIVHVNVPYTPWINPQTGITLTQVLLTENGPLPASLDVALGTVVQWSAEVDALLLPAELIQQVENPLLQVLSGLNPISNTLGWDGGKLIPGQTYQRQMNTPGIYTYNDGLGHQGQVCVGPCGPTVMALSQVGAAGQSGASVGVWLVMGVMAVSTLLWFAAAYYRRTQNHPLNVYHR